MWFTAAVAGDGQLRWTETFTVTGTISQLLAISAALAIQDDQGVIQAVAQASVRLQGLDTMLSNLRVGPNGRSYILESTGLLVASSVPGISSPPFGKERLNFFTNPVNEWQEEIRDILLGPGKSEHNTTLSDLTETHITDVVDVGLSVDGNGYRVMMARAPIDGLNWIIIVITANRDFDGNAVENTRRTALWSGVVLIVAILFGVIFSHVITRPMRSLSDFMSRVAEVNQEGDKDDDMHVQRMHELCEKWEEQIEKTSTRRGSGSIEIEEPNKYHINGEDTANESSRPDTLNPDLPGEPLSCWTRWWLFLTNRMYALQEVHLMQNTFRYMLWSLKSSYEQLQQANEAKRAFIRYIFHEVKHK